MIMVLGPVNQNGLEKILRSMACPRCDHRRERGFIPGRRVKSSHARIYTVSHDAIWTTDIGEGQCSTGK